MVRAAFPAMVAGKADAPERRIRYDRFSPVHAAMDDSRGNQVSGDAAGDREISTADGREIFIARRTLRRSAKDRTGLAAGLAA